MKNIEQERAKHALEISKKISKTDVSFIPGLILQNGLLATYAFLKEKDKKSYEVMESVDRHLIEQKILEGGNILNLVNESSFNLQRATEESLAYLSYVKRFAEKD